MDNEGKSASHAEICNAALDHYRKVSGEACDWSSTVENAIQFYRAYGGAFDIRKIEPKDDIVIAAPIQFEKMSKGGIIIPHMADQPVTGIVVAVGPGKVLKNGDRRPLGVKVGDKILFSKHANLDMTVDGVDLKIVREDSIVGIIMEDGDDHKKREVIHE